MLDSVEISRMSVTERLRAMELLWDALCRKERDVPSPAWHADVLLARKERAARGESKFLTLDELKRRVRAKSGSRPKLSLAK